MSDLISREALKKALKSNCDLCHDKNTNWCEHCCPLNDFEDLIDNAPTVDTEKVLIANVTFDEDKLKDIVQTEVIDKIKSGELVIKEERPKGEVEITNEDIQQAIKEGFSNGYEMAKAKFSSKQGEWICKTKSTFPQYQPDEYKCPFCGHIENRKTKYCCDCGADMRKGGAE